MPGQAHSFIGHIQEGIVQAEADETALLLFSGGQTRKAAGPRSEAEGYWLVAEAAGWWGHAGVRDRAFTEVRDPAHTCRLENYTLTGTGADAATHSNIHNPNPWQQRAHMLCTRMLKGCVL